MEKREKRLIMIGLILIAILNLSVPFLFGGFLSVFYKEPHWIPMVSLTTSWWVWFGFDIMKWTRKANPYRTEKEKELTE